MLSSDPSKLGPGVFIPWYAQNSIAFFKCLKGCHTEEGQDLFSIVPECKTQNNGLKLQEARFQLNIKKNILTVRAVLEILILLVLVMGEERVQQCFPAAHLQGPAQVPLQAVAQHLQLRLGQHRTAREEQRPQAAVAAQGRGQGWEARLQQWVQGRQLLVDALQGLWGVQASPAHLLRVATTTACSSCKVRLWQVVTANLLSTPFAPFSHGAHASLMC
ncbi:uncharacterized protein LOC133376667 isoform X2 [Rhineura floridana]|uniref:uncharacterized protein LOC133376667 isoform X2 n=1 Tax=Rhineura floridana TaxID=261503 RepID=UPI002AC80FB7|nr:uncharacterized protein LOC133376667 isoform X2 [Rhineura floridana]